MVLNKLVFLTIEICHQGTFGWRNDSRNQKWSMWWCVWMVYATSYFPIKISQSVAPGSLTGTWASWYQHQGHENIQWLEMFYIKIFRLKYAKICIGIILTCRLSVELRVITGTESNLMTKERNSILREPGTEMFNTAAVVKQLMEDQSLQSLTGDHKFIKITLWKHWLVIIRFHPFKKIWKKEKIPH